MNDEDSTVALVKAVEKFPVLYDYTLPGYVNKEEVNKAWHKVSQITNLSVDACKEKWRSCRNCWVRDLRYSIICASTKKKKKPYYLADYLGFLTPFTKLRLPKSLEINFQQQVIPPVVREIKEEELSIDDDAPHESEICDYEEETATDASFGDIPKKRPVPDDLSSMFMGYLESKRRKYELEHDSSDMLFFRSLLPEMAHLTPSQKISFKVCILQTLNDMLNSSCDNSLNVHDCCENIKEN